VDEAESSVGLTTSKAEEQRFLYVTLCWDLAEADTFCRHHSHQFYVTHTGPTDLIYLQVLGFAGGPPKAEERGPRADPSIHRTMFLGRCEVHEISTWAL
jgi:hypothetical protein